jgi:chromosome partitioning protein
MLVTMELGGAHHDDKAPVCTLPLWDIYTYTRMTSHTRRSTHSHMHTIAIVGQKGGTSKTCLCQNLGVAASRDNQSVAIIDLDPQTTATNWGDRREADTPSVVSCQVARLRFVLEEARTIGIGWALVDTPGKNAEATVEAAKAADLVLIPVQPNINDLETLPALRDLLRIAGDKPAVVIVSSAPPQGDRHIQAADTATRWGFVACPVTIFRRAAFSDAPLEGLGVQEYEPNGKAAEEVTHLYRYTLALLHAHTGVQYGSYKAQAQ